MVSWVVVLIINTLSTTSYVAALSSTPFKVVSEYPEYLSNCVIMDIKFLLKFDFLPISIWIGAFFALTCNHF
jgi:hypothetical protein